MPDPESRGERVRAARERRSFSQGELARLAGLSRSQVSAIEHGRHVPSVDAALRIADALGQPIEALFGQRAEDPPPAVAGVVEMPPAGARVRTALVGDRLVAAPSGPDPGAWAGADAVVESGCAVALPGGRTDGCVLVGCDPALSAVAALSTNAGASRVVAVAASTGEALAALAAGRCHGALVHGPAGRLPKPPVPVRRWHFARWDVGIAYVRGLGGASLEALLSGRMPLVRRTASAASDQAIVRAARRLRLPAPPREVVAPGHLEAAQRAAWAGGAAVTYAPAAAAHDLAFTPVETHVVELWVAEPWQAHPGVETALDIIGSPAFRARMEHGDGYDLAGAGARVEPA